MSPTKKGVRRLLFNVIVVGRDTTSLARTDASLWRNHRNMTDFRTLLVANANENGYH
jgi:hypothetical protein